jgi:hypothetical protein
MQVVLAEVIPDGGVIKLTKYDPSYVESETQQPSDFILYQNYPNPFNPSTRIKYAIGSRHFVTLMVFDILGNEIMTLVNEEKQPGVYEVEFSAKSGPASSFEYPASGIYFYQLRATPNGGQAGNYIETKKMILLK